MTDDEIWKGSSTCSRCHFRVYAETDTEADLDQTITLALDAHVRRIHPEAELATIQPITGAVVVPGGLAEPTEGRPRRVSSNKLQN